MPIVLGAGVSYSPLIYRQRSDWPDVSDFLIGEVIQPEARASESEERLADFERRICGSFDELCGIIATAQLDALILLCADRGDMFDESNVPQLHIQIGGEVWGDGAIHELNEVSRMARFECDESAAELLIEELVRAGFDVSEGRREFRPLGNAGRGIGPAVAEAGRRLGAGLPVVPLHVNCHEEPTLSGPRLHAFGRALAAAADLTDRRLGILVTGGLSGDPEGPMAGWIDDVLDEWVLARIVRAQSAALARIWAARSRTLKGNSAEIRLWTVAAAALEEADCSARIIDYMPVHHGAAGVAFVAWEQTSCR